MTTKPTIPAAAPTRTAVIPASHPSMSPNPGPRDAPAKNPCFVVTANPSLAKRIATAYGNSPPVRVFLLPSAPPTPPRSRRSTSWSRPDVASTLSMRANPARHARSSERYAASASPARLPALDASTIKQAIGAIVDRASDQKTPMTPSVARLFAAPSRTEIAAAYAERLTKLIAGRRPAEYPRPTPCYANRSRATSRSPSSASTARRSKTPRPRTRPSSAARPTSASISPRTSSSRTAARHETRKP